MKKLFLSFTLSAVATLSVNAGNTPSFPTATNSQSQQHFEPTWESLSQYECPEWFRDIKFGIFLHWGLNSVPGINGHYARHMYWQEKPVPVKGTGWTKDTPAIYKHHVKTYGHPSEFGYKDFIPMWKAENFDANQLATFFKSIGARYVVPVAVHHDNFDNWNSIHHRWNSANMGPKKDIVGDWKKACEEHGLRFGVSTHFNGGHEHVFFQGSTDATGPLAGVPYDTLDPEYEDLYGKRTPDHRKILPEFGDEFLKRHLQLIDDYEPDLLYFDGPLPYGDAGMQVAAHFHNTSIKKHGTQSGVLNLKRGFPDGAATLDIEKGQADKLRAKPWQTDTTINPGWFYLGNTDEIDGIESFEQSYERSHNNEGKSSELRMDAALIIDNLVDIVSKNGNMLLNVGQKADGSISPIYIEELKKVGAWLELNGEAIYGSRPWKNFGEGPTQIKTGYDTEPLKPWSAKDIRFTTKGDTIFAIALDWPDEDLIIKSLSTQELSLEEITSIKLIGDKTSLKWERTNEGLIIKLPKKKSGNFAHVFKITSKI